MGNKASKPARKLQDTVARGTKLDINKSGKVNTLPSQKLKDKFEQAHVQSVETERKEQSIGDKEEKIKHGVEDDHLGRSNESRETISDRAMPEGRDGFDPQGKPNNQGFLDAVTKLGKNINTVSDQSKFDLNSPAIRQLRRRKALYEQGQEEQKMQHLPNTVNPGDAKASSRTMVNSTMLTSILDALQDHRMSNERIAEEYNLKPDFLSGLYPRFKVATNAVILEDKTDHSEISSRQAPAQRYLSLFDGKGKEPETINTERMQVYRNRLGIDEEPSESNNTEKKESN